MNKSIRFVSVLALVAAAAASQAVAIFITGRFTGVTSATGSYTGTVTFNQSDTPFSTVAVNSTTTEVLAGANSTVSYMGATANDAFTVTFNGTPMTMASGVSSFSSAATITSATGAFSGYKGFSGLVTASNNNQSNGLQQFTISGNLTPEPASFAALGVGALALVRRRRKA